MCCNVCALACRAHNAWGSPFVDRTSPPAKLLHASASVQHGTFSSATSLASTPRASQMAAAAVLAGGPITATPRMPQRTLGKTGLQLPVLGFGAGVLGNIFDDVSVDEGTARQAVHAAFAQGINFFDTSPYYGDTKSEKTLGAALQGLPRSEIVVSSKVGRYGADKFDFSAARIQASVRESLERLQLQHLDICICHDVEFGDLDQVIREALPAVAELKAQGLVKAVGFSCLPLKTVKYILDRVPNGLVDCVLSYCHHSLNDDTLLGMLDYLEGKGVGIINASPFSMGLLTSQGPPSWHPAPEELKQACSKAAALATEHDVSLAHLALAYSIKEPRISSNLVGMGNVTQVADNSSCVLRALGLLPDPGRAKEEEALKKVQEVLQPVLNVTWPSGKSHPYDDEA